MPADVAPLVADGGNIRLVRRVAAYAYGSRDVTWPEGAEDPKEELPDGREFGWVAQLAGPRPGLSGRRFVRTDAVIDAVEGVSNTEQLLDDAAERTGGDVHFETLISGRGLAGQEPGVDFRLGDRVPARFWGRLLPGQLVTEVGWDESGPYVKLGGQMLRDLDALARTRAELTRTIRREREETAGAVAAARSHTDSVVARERTERQEDVNQVRVVLGGAQADEESLVSQLAAVQAQITGMVGVGETPPPAGLLNSYLWMNTRLWKQQETINDQNEKFRDMQVEITARQVQNNLLQEYMTEYNRIMAEAYRAHQVTFELKLYDGKLVRFESNSSSSDVKLFSDWPEIEVTPTALHIDLRAIGYEFHTVLRLTHTTEKDSVDEIVLSGPYTTMGRAPQLVIRRPDEFPITETGRYEVDASGLIFPSIVFPEYREKISALKFEFREKGLRI